MACNHPFDPTCLRCNPVDHMGFPIRPFPALAFREEVDDLRRRVERLEYAIRPPLTPRIIPLRPEDV
jgi:hypothetical protein